MRPNFDGYMIASTWTPGVQAVDLIFRRNDAEWDRFIGRRDGDFAKVDRAERALHRIERLDQVIAAVRSEPMRDVWRRYYRTGGMTR